MFLWRVKPIRLLLGHKAGFWVIRVCGGSETEAAASPEELGSFEAHTSILRVVMKVKHAIFVRVEVYPEVFVRIIKVSGTYR